MKKFTAILLAVVLSATTLFTLVGCQSEVKQPEISKVMDNIREQIDMPDMADVTKENMQTLISVTGENFEEVFCIVAGDGYATDEILVGKVLEGVSKDDVIKELEARKKMQYDLAETYNAEGATKVENSVITSKTAGKTDYVLFAVCNDSQKAQKIFNDAF